MKRATTLPCSFYESNREVMLYLARKLGESVIIDNDVEVSVVEIRRSSVKLGFEFPAHVTVLRKEIHQKILEENLAAAISQADEEAFAAFFGQRPEDGKDDGG